jgi:monofunctional biosynthetic peptidoglycan transglycosylase
MKKSKSFLYYTSRWIRNVFVVFILGSVAWTLISGIIPVTLTPLMIIRYVEARKSGDQPTIKKEWVPIEKMSHHLIQAVVASEDNLFLEHKGFSVKDIKKAWENNKTSERIKGGSTISQQTAKNVFLWPERSYLRKGLEAWFTFLMELFWSKKRIMEVYLNVIEMGDGIYGAQAAAREYFSRDASDLTARQAAAIAVCLPNPRRFNPAKPSPYIRRRTDAIVALMRKLPEHRFD